jgi:hypothetical protein
MGRRAWRDRAGCGSLLLISRPIHEVVAELTAGEFRQVVDIVRQWRDHFLMGILPPLKVTDTHRGPSRLLASTNAASSWPAAPLLQSNASLADNRGIFSGIKIFLTANVLRDSKKLVLLDGRLCRSQVHNRPREQASRASQRSRSDQRRATSAPMGQSPEPGSQGASAKTGRDRQGNH